LAARGVDFSFDDAGPYGYDSNAFAGHFLGQPEGQVSMAPLEAA
jgi:hypothetical protein